MNKLISLYYYPGIIGYSHKRKNSTCGHEKKFVLRCQDETYNLKYEEPWQLCFVCEDQESLVKGIGIIKKEDYFEILDINLIVSVKNL